MLAIPFFGGQFFGKLPIVGLHVVENEVGKNSREDFVEVGKVGE